jgi:hypothetical protein
MKNSILFILILSFLLYFQNYSFAYTDSECAELAGKAKTEYAANQIIRECSESDGFFSKNIDLKCAIKAGKAETQSAARRIIRECY